MRVTVLARGFVIRGGIEARLAELRCFSRLRWIILIEMENLSLQTYITQKPLFWINFCVRRFVEREQEEQLGAPVVAIAQPLARVAVVVGGQAAAHRNAPDMTGGGTNE